MIDLIERENTGKILNGYFDELSRKGYVSRYMVKKLIVWLFLVDFVERVYRLMTSEDYNKVNDALICLFSNAGCLLPYEYNMADLSTDDSLVYIFNLRATEDMMLRATDGENLRSVQ